MLEDQQRGLGGSEFVVWQDVTQAKDWGAVAAIAQLSVWGGTL